MVGRFVWEEMPNALDWKASTPFGIGPRVTRAIVTKYARHATDVLVFMVTGICLKIFMANLTRKKKTYVVLLSLLLLYCIKSLSRMHQFLTNIVRCNRLEHIIAASSVYRTFSYLLCRKDIVGRTSSTGIWKRFMEVFCHPFLDHLDNFNSEFRFSDENEFRRELFDWSKSILNPGKKVRTSCYLLWTDHKFMKAEEARSIIDSDVNF